MPASNLQRLPGSSFTQAIAEHFRSVDSAPAGYSAVRPASIYNGFYISFIALSLLSLTAFVIMCNLWAVSPHYDLIFLYQRSSVARIPIRLFFVIFFLTYALYAYTSWGRRAYLAITLTGKFIAACVALDAGALLLFTLAGIETPLLMLQLLAGLVALAIFPHTVMQQAQLPPCKESPVIDYYPLKHYLALLLVLTLCSVTAVIVERRYFDEIEWLRSIGLLGGIGPGIFLVQILFTMCFAVVGFRRNRINRRLSFSPPLAILVPAHNEAHGIAASIASIDRAASSYPGAVKVYIVDNCSRDETTAVAKESIASAQNITGVVLYCGQPGKAFALNYGLSQMTEEFVVRIDADTIIGDDCLRIGMSHFANPRVGSVGGIPLPIEKKGLWRHVRLVEVLLRHGFYQVALEGFHGILGVPGMFAIYRRSTIEEVGGIAQGMNGEDTDICLRLNAAGYLTISDPKAVYYSETPADYSHLREQRLRWFRSVYHISAHNRHILLNPRTISGFVVLPFMLMGAARRAMLLPLILYALLVMVIFDDTYTRLYVGAALAMIVGIPFISAVVICLIVRRWDSLVLVPLYLGFRLLRSYLTLSAALTLVYPPMGSRTRSG